MKKYRVHSYNESTRNHKIQDVETDKTFEVDLFVDSSFKPDLFPELNMSIDKIHEIERSLIEKYIMIERLEPCTYFACNCQLIK